MEIYNINKILVIGLKRFKLNRKIKCFVKFPVNGLDLTDIVKGILLVIQVDIEVDTMMNKSIKKEE